MTTENVPETNSKIKVTSGIKTINGNKTVQINIPDSGEHPEEKSRENCCIVNSWSISGKWLVTVELKKSHHCDVFWLNLLHLSPRAREKRPKTSNRTKRTFIAQQFDLWHGRKRWTRLCVIKKIYDALKYVLLLQIGHEISLWSFLNDVVRFGVVQHNSTF